MSHQAPVFMGAWWKMVDFVRGTPSLVPLLTEYSSGHKGQSTRIMGTIENLMVVIQRKTDVYQWQFQPYNLSLFIEAFTSYSRWFLTETRRKKVCVKIHFICERVDWYVTQSSSWKWNVYHSMFSGGRCEREQEMRGGMKWIIIDANVDDCRRDLLGDVCQLRTDRYFV